MPPNLLQAIEGGRKSGIVRRANAEALKRLKAGLPELAIPKAEPELPRPHTRTIKRLEAQMEALDDLLDQAKESSDWRDLTTARMRLFDQWCVLSGIHKPGPSKAPSVSRRPVAGPSYDPTPAQIVVQTPPQVVESPLVVDHQTPQGNNTQ